MSTSPSRLGKYELHELLGRGSTGEVWKGFDLQSRSDVAVRLLHPDLLQTDPNFMTTFMKEWQSISSLHQPNIVQVHEVSISRPSTSSGTIPTSNRPIFCLTAPTRGICQAGNHCLPILVARTGQETELAVNPSIFPRNRPKGIASSQVVIFMRLGSSSMKCVRGCCHSMMRA